MGFTDTRGKFWYHGNGISIQTQGGFIMTKLFSMKSLAFAGAAAFALTLAAAPQADAATVTATVDYDAGTLTVDPNGNDLTKTDDGYVIYYQANAKEAKIKDNKYSAIALPEDQTIDISNLMGKATNISLSVDGKKVEDATKVAIVASPKIKATYSVEDGITLKNGKGSDAITEGNVASGSSLGFVAQVKTGTYGSWKTVKEDTISTIVNQAKALGTTLYIRVANGTDGNLTTPWSKEVKVKISAQAKAPSATFKLNATKAFTWKISNKQQYKIKVGETAVTGWESGSNTADSWTKIFETVKADTSVVSGDAITADVKIYLRTAADEKKKKAASAINVINLEKSVASPTSSAVTIEPTVTTTTKGKKTKITTSASIKAVVDIQYSTDDGKKWTLLKTNKTVKFSADKTILVRLPGVGNTTLPSLNTSLDFKTSTGNVVMTTLDYDGSAVVAKDTTIEPTIK
jgi:hypothetical protein